MNKQNGINLLTECGSQNQEYRIHKRLKYIVIWLIHKCYHQKGMVLLEWKWQRWVDMRALTSLETMNK